MLKKIIVHCFVALIVLGFIASAFSMGDRPPKRKEPPKVIAETYNTAIGNVSSVNLSGSTLSISIDAKKSITVTVDPKTELMKKGKIIRLADVKKGDLANITYGTVSGKNIAKVVKIVEERSIRATNKTKRK